MDESLDLRSLKCPLPALMTERALARRPPGAALTVLADDPLAALDIAHMCHTHGHAVESVIRHGAYTEFRLRSGQP
jgi:tRNA 2-thiouridine synthesizing protein A